MGKLLPGLVVSFVNQKGGAGKSTLTAHYANWLFATGKNKKLRIAVVDCDNQQATLASKRERELSRTDKKEDDLYTVIRMPSNYFSDHLLDMQEVYDIILVDLPGNMEQAGVMEIYHMIDVAFIPFRLAESDLDGTLAFWKKYEQVIAEREKLGYKTTVKGLANMVKTSTAEFKDFQNGLIHKIFPFDVFDIYLRECVDFCRFSTIEIKEDKQLNEVFDELTKTVTSHIKE